jgi:hypothetical protein
VVTTTTTTSTTTSTTTGATTTRPPPPVKAAHGKLKLYPVGLYSVLHHPSTAAGRGVEVEGHLRPYAPGQSVLVKEFLSGHLIHSERVHVGRSRGGSFGRFLFWVPRTGAGEVSLSVLHGASAQIGRVYASTSYAALDTNVGFGSVGRFVVLLQQRLGALHFYVPQTGVYDTGTGLAIDAYHRLLGWGTSQSLDSGTISYLMSGWGEFKVRYPQDGKHAEGNLGQQLLALVHGSHVDAIYPISSGKPSTPTVLGRFQVYRRVPGYQPDGMYFSSYFIGGYAIHGYDPAPDYPASHGCMRLPIQDALSVWNWINFGDGVDVYY